MIHSDQVKQYIAAGLPCAYLDVHGDGHHFYVTVVSEHFANKRLIDRHRLIKDIIKTQLHSNEIHALSIVKALTPEEWNKHQG